MGFAEFIGGKFIGKEMCVFLSEDAETIALDQNWIANKAFFKGTIESVDSGILTLVVPNCGPIYINCETISAIWGPDFDYHQAIRTSLKKRMPGARQKDR